VPRIVSDDEGALKPGDRPNNFMPMIAVNRKGIVGISWYDRRDNPDNLGYCPRFRASLDGGRTWLPSIRVSTSANLVNDEKETRFNSGDTTGLTADASGIFHPLWIDNRSGVHQMWTTTVTVPGAGVRCLADMSGASREICRSFEIPCVWARGRQLTIVRAIDI